MIKTIRKYRSKISKDLRVSIDSENGMARMTALTRNDCRRITIVLDIPFDGEAVITPDALKYFDRVLDPQRFEVRDNEFALIGEVEQVCKNYEEDLMKPIKDLGYIKYPMNLKETSWVGIAASSDKARPVLCALSFQGDTLVATDGFRIHIIEGEFGEALVPAEILDLIPVDFDIVHLEDTSIAFFEYDDCKIRIEAPHIEGSFPDYRAIIKFKPKVSFSLLQNKALERTKSDFVGIFENGTITCRPDKTDGTIKTVIELCEVEGVKFGVRPQYLLEAMYDYEVTVGFVAHNTPLMVENEGKLAVVMPMHIS